MSRLHLPSRRWLIFPPILIGLGIAVLLVRSRSGPEEIELSERRTAVRVLRATRTDVVPRVIGYGLVEPDRIWQVVAQVAGRVVEKHPRAEAGVVAQEGAVLLTIDPRAYELSIRESEARIAKIDADLVELETREANTRRTLQIEERSLEASKRELERRRGAASGVVAQSEVDKEEARYLLQLVRVDGHENALKLFPAQKQALEASRRASEAELELARLDVSYTTIDVPFDCRLVHVDFEEAEYVSVGQVLAEAHGMETAEVTAHMPMARMRHLIHGIPARPAGLAEFLPGELLEQLGLEARVLLRTGDFSAAWDGRVDRVRANIDPETRTLGVVVAVDEPYVQAIPGVRPPLVQDMFCEVEIRGRPISGKVVIPRSALHDGEVYIVEGERLRRRPVQVAFALHDFVCLAEGLADGEVLVLSDPVPAIDGMLLETTPDLEVEQRVAAVASGEAEIR